MSTATLGIGRHRAMHESEKLRFDHELRFSHRLLDQACRYWHDAAGGRAMPARGDLDPAAMAGFLAHVTLFDVCECGEGPPTYRYRLQGTAMAEIYGEQTGRTLAEALPDRRQVSWQSALDLVRVERRPVRTFGRLLDPARSWLIGENLLAPLSADGTAVDMIFCAMVFHPEGAATAPL